MTIPPEAPLSRLLTPRQQEVAMLVSEGLPDKQIAARLGLSHKTVGYHVLRIRTRLGLDATRDPRVLITRMVLAA